MYLKSFELRNFRKFYYDREVSNNVIAFSDPNKNKDGKIDIASRTSLLIGQNNCGKTTIVAGLDKLLNSNPSFNALDFNLDYIEKLFKQYVENISEEKECVLPEMEFVFHIELDETDDLIHNISPFLSISSANNNDVIITAKWEVKEETFFKTELKKIIDDNSDYSPKLGDDNYNTICKEERLKKELFNLLSPGNFKLNYYNSLNEVIENFKISNLIEINVIKANKVDTDRCLHDALKKIIDFRYKNADNTEVLKKSFDNNLHESGYQITQQMKECYTKDVNETFNSIISSSHKVGMKIDLNLDNLMSNLVKCEYMERNRFIPEKQYGLGYTNLIVIISDIISYVDNYHNDTKNSKLHLIAIEEPETYMHPQMQELFIKKINDAINDIVKDKKINSQLLITTHSSHILNSKIHSGNSLNNINYIKCCDDNPKIVNLNDKNISSSAKKDELFFIKKHIKFKISELFFAEAAIFVEGITEYHLLQYYIDTDETLSAKTISLILIDGAHAKVYEKLIKMLGIPVLIITDLDIKRDKKEKGSLSKEDIKNGLETKFTQISDISERKTTNNTLKHFYKCDGSLSQIVEKNYVKKDSLMICSQIEPIKGFYATSFEEAFVLTNNENTILNETIKEIKPSIYKECSADDKIDLNASFKLQCKLSDDKSNFANTLLFNMLMNNKKPDLPKYIEDGFQFIIDKLGEKK